MKKSIMMILLILFSFINSYCQIKLDYDEYKTTSGKFKIYLVGHASLIIEVNDKFIYIDPVSKMTDYSILPKADLILLTHHHPDHLDLDAINILNKTNTDFIQTDSCFKYINRGKVIKNGDKIMFSNISIEAVPAYNTTKDKEKFHPRGRDNGYILTIDNMRIYIAGDTENIPEMKNLKNIDIAFLPMNQPYTMTPEQVAEAVNKFNPKILYPYHTGETDISKLVKLLKNNKNTVVKIKEMK
jgi:L-ascorbate metabolism protein UlaG (beta-lactamase superfamily)